ncbi:hypothetical protein CAPTEDRAFT_226121 [Capitella teleta]|uniref:DUF19 domain-containing protein n=1 Tax=Capitella teleta TaxID=283909 RepID=R7TWL4_CAPTE|nr:hypothetical protein CAPTEDRAFT_226121 [Capitella teleta]|eukprot:ELT98154.1 hypothetical protein CAPTEDRAFT_226121 [Capitella teleta]
MAKYSAGSDEYCGKVPFVYADTYSCVYPAVDSCTDGDKTSVTESLDQLKNEINQECSGGKSSCEDVTGFVQRDIIRCVGYQGGLDDVLLSLINSFHTTLQKGVSTDCNQLENITDCMALALEKKSDCSKYTQTIRKVYLQYDHLAMAQYMCPAVDPVLYGDDIAPWVSSCPTSQRLKEMKEKCVLVVPNKDEFNALRLCGNMQTQINCMMAYLKNCPSIQREYMEPRLDSYASLNYIYGCNISIDAVEIKQIKGRENEKGDCNLRNFFKYDCGGFFTQALPSYPSEIAIGVSLLYKWNDALCNSSKYVDYEQLKTCVAKFRAECYYPQDGIYSGYSEESIPEDIPFAPEIGPFASNVWGITWLQNSVYETCFQGCENATMIYEECLQVNDTGFQDIITDISSNTQNCDVLTSMAQCVSDVAQLCPTLIERAKAECDGVSSNAQDVCSFKFDFLPLDPLLTTTTTTARTTDPVVNTINYTMASAINRGSTKKYTPTPESRTTPVSFESTSHVNAAPPLHGILQVIAVFSGISFFLVL